MALDVYKQWLGIPEEFRPPTHYQLLRVVDFEDDPQKIEAHYKKLNSHVRKYATGQFSLESQDLLNELAKAMLCLIDPVRKREYDEGLGREFEEDPNAETTTGQILINEGHISKDQMKEAEDYANRRGISMRDAVVQMKLVDHETATRALAGERKLSYVNLADLPPDDSILDRVPRNVVKRNAILPLYIDDDVLLIACSEEPEMELEDEMRLRFGIPMRAVLATPLSINQAIAQHYAPGMREEAVTSETATTKKSSKKSASKKTKSKGKSTQPTEKFSETEISERKKTGYVLILFSAIFSNVFASYVIYPYIIPNSWSIASSPYLIALLTMLIVVPPASSYAYFNYIKN